MGCLETYLRPNAGGSSHVPGMTTRCCANAAGYWFRRLLPAGLTDACAACAAARTAGNGGVMNTERCVAAGKATAAVRDSGDDITLLAASQSVFKTRHYRMSDVTLIAV